MSSRMRKRRNRRADYVRARSDSDLIARVIANRDPERLACSYGCHTWTYSPDGRSQTCTVCGGVYAVPNNRTETETP